MADGATDLGGRLPLAGPDGLAPEQQRAHDLIDSKFVPWANAAGFRAKDEEGRLVGPFNSALYSPEISSAFLDWQTAEQQHTPLDPRTREVVILTVGAIWRSAHELYAHAAMARKVGLPEEAIEQLCAAEEPGGLSRAEVVAHRLARQLTAQRQVEAALFEDAKTLFGLRGLVDLVNLVGAYQTVCGILNAFTIPTPQE